MRSAPHSLFSLAISSIKATVSAEIFGLEEAALDLYFQYSLNPWRCHRRSVVFLDDEQSLLPGSNCSCQEHQEHPIGLFEDRSFDLTSKENERLSKERVFCHEFGLASCKIRYCSQQKRSAKRFCPVYEAVLKQLKTHASQSLY